MIGADLRNLAAWLDGVDPADLGTKPGSIAAVAMRLRSYASEVERLEHLVVPPAVRIDWAVPGLPDGGNVVPLRPAPGPVWVGVDLGTPA